MLTMKNVLPDGYETVFTVRRVSYQPVSSMVKRSSDDVEIDRVWAERDDGTTFEATDGTVYVMNDAGKTVATYHLWYPAPDEIYPPNAPAHI